MRDTRCGSGERLVQVRSNATRLNDQCAEIVLRCRASPCISGATRAQIWLHSNQAVSPAEHPFKIHASKVDFFQKRQIGTAEPRVCAQRSAFAIG